MYFILKGKNTLLTYKYSVAHGDATYTKKFIKSIRHALKNVKEYILHSGGRVLFCEGDQILYFFPQNKIAEGKNVIHIFNKYAPIDCYLGIGHSVHSCYSNIIQKENSDTRSAEYADRSCQETSQIAKDHYEKMIIMGVDKKIALQKIATMYPVHESTDISQTIPSTPIEQYFHEKRIALKTFVQHYDLPAKIGQKICSNNDIGIVKYANHQFISVYWLKTQTHERIPLHKFTYDTYKVFPKIR